MSQRWTCLDTADWRLHRAGMTLRDRRRGRTGELVLTAPGGERISAPARSGTWPRRLELVPASPVRDRVAPTVGIRALLPMAAVDSRSTHLRLLDDLEKTRVRVQIDQQRLLNVSHAPLPLRVVLTPLRGYERDARRCAKLLTDSLAAFDGQSDAVAAALTAAGRVPGAEISALAPTAPYDPDAPAARSIAAVLLGYLDIVDTNLPGVVDDLDPEFLHDLRSAVAAIRSILTLTGDVLAGASADHFIAEFVWVDQLTRQVRDLDVFLLDLLGHGHLDVSGLETLDPLRRHVVRQRGRACRSLRAALSTHRMTALTNDFRRLLERVAASEATNPATAATIAAVVPVAYAMVGADRTVSPLIDVVALQGQCKPLRYLLDAFRPAFDPAAATVVLTGLHKLQDLVDDVVSARRQLQQLTDSAASLAAVGAPVESLLAVGALHDRVRRYETDAQRELGARLARFGGRRMNSQLQVLLPTAPDEVALVARGALVALVALQQSSL